MSERFFTNEYLRFLRESFSQVRSVGAVAPSSAALAAKMIAPIDFAKARVLVELGPGTGVFTRALLAHMHKDASLLALETNDNFRNEVAKITDPRLRISGASATDLAQVLGVTQADVVISGIPLAMLKHTEKQQLLAGVRQSLSNEGVFTQFQYSLESYRALRNHFAQVSLAFTPWNIPPAIIYTCRT
ncbi:MAG: hypothetical protein A2542_03850 [Parcubacteria group bacterium RIFOXYD2_FULL_52_8]|nr:MAG: hypothetical protein A2542_03850 [Parcubacteria group bacterium RIFOXYD2_FULL_52_8]